ncbi:MAG: hypothetical protein AMDU2_EPLC00012G0089 [Thermoplasmatales archaeon E-plasma]|nr:MAG: hypothetical protein AMDU2_EPLC00012G0089 [Thermoplasmatales archaeon E-plasma]
MMFRLSNSFTLRDTGLWEDTKYEHEHPAMNRF